MKTQDTIQFYTYPQGIADSMGQDEFVLVRNKLGSLDTKFVGDLVEGDYYCQRIPAPLPPRSADDILKYIADNQLGFCYAVDEDGIPRMIEVYKGGDILCSSEYNDNCIRNAIEPLMEMEEL
jgi:hypothetical protein